MNSPIEINEINKVFVIGKAEDGKDFVLNFSNTRHGDIRNSRDTRAIYDHGCITGYKEGHVVTTVKFVCKNASIITESDMEVVSKERLFKLIEDVVLEAGREEAAWQDPKNCYLSPYDLGSEEVKKSIVDYLTGKTNEVIF